MIGGHRPIGPSGSGCCGGARSPRRRCPGRSARGLSSRLARWVGTPALGSWCTHVLQPSAGSATRSSLSFDGLSGSQLAPTARSKGLLGGPMLPLSGMRVRSRWLGWPLYVIVCPPRDRPYSPAGSVTVTATSTTTEAGGRSPRAEPSLGWPGSGGRSGLLDRGEERGHVGGQQFRLFQWHEMAAPSWGAPEPDVGARSAATPGCLL